MSEPTLDFLDLDIGPEIDALVALRVMGVAPVEWNEETPCGECRGIMRYCGARSWCYDCGEWRVSPYREYSSDTVVAFSVLDAFGSAWWIERFRDATYEVRIFRPENAERNDYGTARARTLELAICRAAITSAYCYGAPAVSVVRHQGGL